MLSPVARRPDDLDERRRTPPRSASRDNDWIEAVNRNGVVVARAIVSHRMPEGTVYMYHAQDRLIDVPHRRDVAASAAASTTR